MLIRGIRVGCVWGYRRRHDSRDGGIEHFGAEEGGECTIGFLSYRNRSALSIRIHDLDGILFWKCNSLWGVRFFDFDGVAGEPSSCSSLKLAWRSWPSRFDMNLSPYPLCLLRVGLDPGVWSLCRPPCSTSFNARLNAAGSIVSSLLPAPDILWPFWCVCRRSPVGGVLEVGGEMRPGVWKLSAEVRLDDGRASFLSPRSAIVQELFWVDLGGSEWWQWPSAGRSSSKGCAGASWSRQSDKDRLDGVACWFCGCAGQHGMVMEASGRACVEAALATSCPSLL